MITTELLTSAKKLNHHEVYAGSGTDYWTSTTAFKVIVPTGYRAFVLGGYVEREVSGTVTVKAYDVGDNIIASMDYQAAATGSSTWPTNTDSTAMLGCGGYPIILDAGEYVLVTFGAAQSTAAFASVRWLEVKV